MIGSRVTVLALVVLSVASTVSAQPREPIGRFVVDVRGASAGLPSAPGWTLVVLPAGTSVPGRGLGLEIGGHVYVARFGPAALGLGASWLTARGSATQPPPETGTPAPPPGAASEVTTRITSLAPQISLNFGHALGWSYLSVGLGRTRVESEVAGGGSAVTPKQESGWVKTLNFGGGARWFLNEHLGVGFDLRWHKLTLIPPSATHPGAPRATMLVAGAGLVLK